MSLGSSHLSTVSKWCNSCNHHSPDQTSDTVRHHASNTIARTEQLLKTHLTNKIHLIKKNPPGVFCSSISFVLQTRHFKIELSSTKNLTCGGVTVHREKCSLHIRATKHHTQPMIIDAAFQSTYDFSCISLCSKFRLPCLIAKGYQSKLDRQPKEVLLLRCSFHPNTDCQSKSSHGSHLGQEWHDHSYNQSYPEEQRGWRVWCPAFAEI